jgi:tripartite-type tricarboxylate transporter receptor subunit TctC
MTGGGSLIAANYVYRRAKPDGLTVGIWNSGIILQQVLGEKKVKFEANKFGWVGAPVKGWPTCAIMGHTGLKTLKEVVNSNQRIKVGATRAGSTTDDLPKILNRTLGTKFDVISGYTGTATIRIAMQKQEVDAACWGWESMGITARAMLDATGDGRLIPFLIHGTIDDPEVKDLPRILDAIKGDNNLATFRAWASTYDFQRPLSLPPGTPKDRLAILRKAYRATMQDPAFLADAEKSKLILSYVSGEDIEKHIATILGTPAAAKERLGFLVRKKKKK